MKIGGTLKRLWGTYRLKPHVRITESGGRTPNPKVHVGFYSRGGMAGALTFPADDPGQAKATSYAKTYARILGLRVIDARKVPEIAEQKDGVG